MEWSYITSKPDISIINFNINDKKYQYDLRNNIYYEQRKNMFNGIKGLIRIVLYAPFIRIKPSLLDRIEDPDHPYIYYEPIEVTDRIRDAAKVEIDRSNKIYGGSWMTPYASVAT